MTLGAWKSLPSMGDLWRRIRAWWRDPSIMRAFFCYAAVWLATATLFMVVGISACMELLSFAHRQVNPDAVNVSTGPYIFDDVSGDLVPASQMYVNDDPNTVVFVGLTAAARSMSSQAMGVTGAWDEDARVANATVELLRNSPSYLLFDWGGNYTEEDYRTAGGNPYDESSAVQVDNLAAYDATERASRVRTDKLFSTSVLGEGVLISNVGYYVMFDEDAGIMPVSLALRLVAGVLVPIAAYGGMAFLFFRRFYRRYIGGPLAVLGAAADRIASQDLDASVSEVPGRELGRLARAMEHMRESLLLAQRDLWHTAEDRRRLNAAFAHDLRTPVTVLKGTIEMARMRMDMKAGDGAAGCGLDGASDGSAAPVVAVPDRAVLDTLYEQVERLETYAKLMSRVAKLEDRAVARRTVLARDALDELERCATGYAASYKAHRELQVACGDGMRAAESAGTALHLDMQLVEEVLGNMLSNACAHAQKTIAVKIEHALDGMLVLTIVDDGRGFTAEALHRGCDPFYSEEKSAEHFGLGLNIARTLARLHGGDVVLGNREEGGACVVATFAVAPQREN